MSVLLRTAVLLMLVMISGVTRAQDAAIPAPVATATQPEAADDQSTAAGALKKFLSAFPDPERERPDRVNPDALAVMEFAGSFSMLTINERRSLAFQLKSVIDRLRFIDFAEVEEEVGTSNAYVLASTPGASVRMRRGDDGVWKFTSRTIEELPQLLDEVAGMANVGGTKINLEQSPRQWVRAQVPEGLRAEVAFLEAWQWLFILIVILTGVGIDRITVWVLIRVERRVIVRLDAELSKEEESTSIRPIGLVAMAIFWYASLHLLLLPVAVHAVLSFAIRVFGSLAFIWAASRFVDTSVNVARQKAAKTANRFDDLLVPFVGRVAKIFIVAFALIFVAQNMGLNITSLLAGLGLGGLAFALAAKDTIENMFGSMTVLLDRPFRVGDWITIPGGIEGTVETVGLRSSRIRTSYDSLITVPNSMLIRSQVDNFGERRYRRWRTFLSVQYDTPPEKIEAFCEGLRELVRLHPSTRKDVYHIYANEFGAHSLDILCVIFFEVPEYADELKARHALFIDVMRLAARLGVVFAFPTQTLQMIRAQNPVYTEIPALGEQALEQGRELARTIVKPNP